MAYDAYPKTVKAHFDGRVIVPDEHLNLLPNVPLKVSIHQAATDPRSIPERLAAMNRLFGSIKGRVLDDSAFDRDSLYREL